jgi:acyl transferase domain-containing protein/surfactin synthase thioesterase subunit/acyl carrier protein/NAD(P)-dependent dehydrogenase (short-subunit alcohol dehydrogenase family)
LLVLTSRNADIPSPILREMDAAGCRVIVQPLDSSKPDGVYNCMQWVRENLPMVQHYVHAAGVAGFALLQDLHPHEIMAIASPKSIGATIVAQQSNLPWESLVFMSSVSSIWSHTGGAAYSAGNAALDTLACSQSYAGKPATSVQLGPFAEVGMAASYHGKGDLSDTNSKTASLGLQPLPPVALHDAIMAAGSKPVSAYALIDMDRFHRLYTSKGPWNLLDAAKSQASTSFSAVKAVNPILDSVTAPPHHQVSNSTPLKLVDTIRRVARAIIGEVAEQMEEFPPGGFDSLSAVEFSNSLGEELGIELPATIVYDYPSVSSMAAYIEPMTGSIPPMPAIQRNQVEVLDSRSVRHAADLISIDSLVARVPGSSCIPSSLSEDRVQPGLDAIQRVPFSRWDVDSSDSQVLSKYMSSRPVGFGGFLHEVDRFDASVFGISGNEAELMDPQHRVLLEVAYESMTTRLPSERSLDTGVYLGIQHMEYGQLSSRHLWSLGPFSATGGSFSVAAGRISFTFGLRGPAISIETACSSSLVALHSASLHNSDALVAAVNLTLSERTTSAAQVAGMLTLDGRCKTLDASADGYVRSEACVAFMLRRHIGQGESLSMGCQILLNSSAVNQDGRSSSLTAPNGPAQQAVIRSALIKGRVGAEDVGILNLHGTGTALGDPIEIGAAMAILGRPSARPMDSILHLHASKAAWGHAEPASGALGILNSILTATRSQGPGIPHLRQVNPLVSTILSGSLCAAPSRQTGQRGLGHQQCLGVSAFAFQGTNSHVILQVQRVLDGEEGLARERVQHQGAGIVWERTRFWVAPRSHALLRQAMPRLMTGFNGGGRKATVVRFQLSVHRNSAVHSSLMDHQIAGTALFPAAAMLEACHAAIKAVNGDLKTAYAGQHLVDCSIASPYVLPPPTEPRHMTMDASLFIEADLGAGFVQLKSIEARNDAGAYTISKETNHMTCCAVRTGRSVGRRTTALQEAICRHSTLLPNVLVPAPRFSISIRASTANLEALGRYTAVGECFTIHPAVLDCMTQTGAAAFESLLQHDNHIQAEVRVPVGLSCYSCGAASSDGCKPLCAIALPVLPSLKTRLNEAACSYSLHPIEPQSDYAALLSISSMVFKPLVRSKSEKMTTFQERHSNDMPVEEASPEIYQVEWQASSCMSASLSLPRRAVSLSVSLPHMHNVTKEIDVCLSEEASPTLLGMLQTSVSVLSLMQSALPWYRMTITTANGFSDYQGRPTALSNALYGASLSGMARVVEQETRAIVDHSFHGDSHIPRMRRSPVPRDDWNKPVSLITTGTCFITGGLGEVGMLVATWIGQPGPEPSMLLLGRTGRTVNQGWMNNALITGCHHIKMVSCDVGYNEDMSAFSHDHSASLSPVSFLVHAGGVIRDTLLQGQTPSTFRTVAHPKVVGARQIVDTLSHASPVEQLVYFSSLSSHLGTPGQANYAAANSVLDEMARSSRAMGQPARSISWGPWALGMASPQLLDRFAKVGMVGLTVTTGLRLLERVIYCQNSRVQVPSTLIAAHMSWKRLFASRRDNVPELFAEVVFDEKSVRTEAKEAVDSVMELTSKPSTSALDVPIIVQDAVMRLIGGSIQADRPLMEAGLDSLGAVELRNELQQSLHIELPATLVFDYPTVNALTSFVSSSLDRPTVSTVKGRVSESHVAGTVAIRTQLPSSINQVYPGKTAILSISCRYPYQNVSQSGSVSSTDTVCGPIAFWKGLVGEADLQREVPPSRWDVDLTYAPSPSLAPHSISSYARFAALCDNIDLFDVDAFTLSHQEGMSIDPQVRILLEETASAMIAASAPSSSAPSDLTNTQPTNFDTTTGVFVGCMYHEYLSFMASTSNGPPSPHAIVGNGAPYMVGRLSYAFGFTGPCVSTDTACSSSLVAAHLGNTALHMQECGRAAVGGTNIMLDAYTTAAICQLQALSPVGRCKTFDVSADGYGRGEGFVLFVLGSMENGNDAQSPVAWYVGSAINQGGRGGGLTAPNGPAQSTLIQNALASGGVDPVDVALVSIHGTGTPLGDPIEVGALSSAFSQHPMSLVSNKSCYGHTEGAAGLTGLLAAVQASTQQTTPGIMHLRTINPYVYSAIDSWNKTSKRNTEGNNKQTRAPRQFGGVPNDSVPTVYAGTSSFGMSGVNAHAIVCSHSVLLNAEMHKEVSVHWKRQYVRALPHPHVLETRFHAGGRMSSLTGYPGSWAVESRPLCVNATTGGLLMNYRVQNIACLPPSWLAEFMSLVCVNMVHDSLRDPSALAMLTHVILAHRLVLQDPESSLVPSSRSPQLLCVVEAGGRLSVYDVMDSSQTVLSSAFVGTVILNHDVDKSGRQDSFDVPASETPQSRALSLLTDGSRTSPTAVHTPLLARVDGTAGQPGQASQLRAASRLEALVQVPLTTAVESLALESMLVFTVRQSMHHQQCWGTFGNRNLSDCSFSECTLHMAAVQPTYGSLVGKMKSLGNRDVAGTRHESHTYAVHWLASMPAQSKAVPSSSRLLSPMKPELSCEGVSTFNAACRVPEVLNAAVDVHRQGGVIQVQAHRSQRWPGSTRTSHTPSSFVFGMLSSLPYEVPSLMASTMYNDPLDIDAPAVPLTLSITPPAEKQNFDAWGTSTSGFVVTKPLLLYDTPRLGELEHMVSMMPSALVTGGLSGLGLLTATWVLSSHTHATVTLLGRSGIVDSSHSGWDLKASQGLVLVVKGDASATEDASYCASSSALSDRNHPITWIFYAAGVQSAAGLLRQGPSTIRKALSPKEQGVRGLAESAAASGSPLETAILFSSVSSLIGNAQHGNYAGANAVLDVLTQRYSSTGRPTVSVQWGAWAAVGMVRDRYASLTDLQARKLGMLSTEVGLRVMNEILTAAVAQNPVVGAAPQAYWINLLKAAGGQPPLIFSAITSATGDGRGEDIPQQLRQNLASSSGTTSTMNVNVNTLESDVLRLVSSILDVQDIDGTTALAMQGLDSLAALELRQRLQEAYGVELATMAEDPQGATVDSIVSEIRLALSDKSILGNRGASDESAVTKIPEIHQSSVSKVHKNTWIAPAPTMVKLRLFCLPWAGGVSENLFARWSMMLPASIQVCPVEIPGRGRRENEAAPATVEELAATLARSLPLSDKPYIIFGTCLGAIVGYEIIREVQRTGCAPMPLAFMPAAVSPPHVYASVVAKIYMQRRLWWGESPPLDEVMAVLRGWKDLPREKLLKAFEAGHFAGVEEMKKSQRLFDRVAPMGVADIMMAVQYKYDSSLPPLDIPIISFDGKKDNTIPKGYMKGWRKHTRGRYRNVDVDGTHYFVSTHYKEVTTDIGRECLGIMESLKGGLLGQQHSWVGGDGGAGENGVQGDVTASHDVKHKVGPSQGANSRHTFVLLRRKFDVPIMKLVYAVLAIAIVLFQLAVMVSRS